MTLGMQLDYSYAFNESHYYEIIIYNGAMKNFFNGRKQKNKKKRVTNLTLLKVSIQIKVLQPVIFFNSLNFLSEKNSILRFDCENELFTYFEYIGTSTGL